MRQEMHAETVQCYVRAAGYKLQRGLPLFLRRGMMGSHIFLVHVRDEERKEYIPLIFKYHHGRQQIEREATQYRLLKAAIGERLVSIRSSGRECFLLVEYVPYVENLADLLRVGDSKRFEDMQEAVRKTLQFMVFAWTAFSMDSPAGVPTVYANTLRVQRRKTPFGDLGRELKRTLGKLGKLEIVVNGQELGFSATDAFEEIHRTFSDARMLRREILTHGDLNPGNVLVAMGGIPRIIDCRAVGEDQVGEDWVRDLAYLARCRNTATLQAYEGEVPREVQGKLALTYKATTAAVCDTILEICRTNGAEMAKGKELCDPGWERRFWLHIAAAWITEIHYLERRIRWGVIPSFPHLHAFLLGEAFLAVAKAREVKK